MVKCLPEFEYFYCVLEEKNIIFKIRRSKVTDYAALKYVKVNQESSFVQTWQGLHSNAVDQVPMLSAFPFQRRRFFKGFYINGCGSHLDNVTMNIFLQKPSL